MRQAFLRNSMIGLVALFSTSSSLAEVFQVDNIYYETIDDATVEVVPKGYYNGNSDYCIGDIVIPESITAGNKQYTVSGIGQSAFSNCHDMTSIELPATITSIGKNAFTYCESIKTILIPDGVASIESNTFSFCKELKTIKLGKNISSIQAGAFDNCGVDTLVMYNSLPPSLASISSTTFISQIIVFVPKGSGPSYRETKLWNDNIIIEEDEDLITINVDEPGTLLSKASDITNPATIGKLKLSGELVKNDWEMLRQRFTSLYYVDLSELSNVEIPQDQFKGKYFLIDIILPTNLESFGNNAFSGCTRIQEITFENNVSIGSSAFKGCTSLKYIPSEKIVGILGTSAFEGCDALEQFSASNELTEISSKAFSGCKKLSNLELSESIVTIGSNAFNGCVSLYHVPFCEGLTKIGSSAFYGCKSLTEVILPSTLTSIGDQCFLGTDLRQVFAPWDTPISCGLNSFFTSPDNSHDCTLYIPHGSMEAYASAKGWKYFYNIDYHENFNVIVTVSTDNQPSRTNRVYNLYGTQSELSNQKILIKEGKKIIYK